MINREELIRSKEYWLEKIQNALFVELEDYIEKNNLNKTKFAEKLGVSKSYLSQVLNGNFDHKLSKLIELSLAIDKIPMVKFENIENCLALDEANKLDVAEKYDININLGFGFTTQSFDDKVEPTRSVFEKHNKKQFTTRFSFVEKKNNKILA
ncbi:helix-turn-helix transcriptional regulator [Flavobacteriaceae bacterium]|nr:helix-turn-helix transcriptional regulator [Flavobacteriaceae bacterium]